MKALVVSLLVVTTALGVEITEWRNVQTLDVPQPGLRKVSLPPATLHAARAGLEDLRILDATGREVPYALERSARRLPALRNPKNFTVTITGRKTILLLETGCPEPVEAVTLLTPARDFIKAVTVEGSADQQTWQPLAAGQPIFRQATGAGNLRVAIPEGQWAFLRVTVDDGRAEAVPFTGAQLHALTGENARVEAVPVVISDRSENNTQTRLTLDLAGVAANRDERAVVCPRRERRGATDAGKRRHGTGIGAGHNLSGRGRGAGPGGAAGTGARRAGVDPRGVAAD